MKRDDWLFLSYFVMLAVHAHNATIDLHHGVLDVSAASGIAAGFGLTTILFRIGGAK